MTASLLFNIVVLAQACMFTSTVASNSAQAGVNEMKAHMHATDSALAAINRHRRTSSTKTPAVTCAICGHRVFPLTGDTTGTMHELCSIRMLDESSLPAATQQTVYKHRTAEWCGICGKDILHTDSDKVHRSWQQWETAGGKRYVIT